MSQKKKKFFFLRQNPNFRFLYFSMTPIDGKVFVGSAQQSTVVCVQQVLPGGKLFKSRSVRYDVVPPMFRARGWDGCKGL